MTPLDKTKNTNTDMSYFLVRYFREGLTTIGTWVPVMDGGFISEDCSLEEVKAKVAEIVSWHDGIQSRISTPSIEKIDEATRDAWLKSDACFWSRQLSKMTYKAAEAFQKNP